MAKGDGAASSAHRGPDERFADLPDFPRMIRFVRDRQAAFRRLLSEIKDLCPLVTMRPL